MQFCSYQQHIQDFLSKYIHFLFNVSAETRLVQLEPPPWHEDRVLWLLLAGAGAGIGQV